MMKTLIFSLLFTLLPVLAVAQEEFPGDRNFVYNSLWDNWFISAGGGVNLYWGTDDAEFSLSKRLAPGADLSVGKWLHPVMGLRLQYAGLKAKGATYGLTQYAKPGSLAGQFNTQEFNVGNLHVDYLFNLSNALGGYKPERRFDVIPFVGIGVARSSFPETTDKAVHKLTVNGGVIGKFHINDKFDANLECRSFYVHKDFDGEHDGRILEGMGTLSVGVTYRFGKKKEFVRLGTITSAIHDKYATSMADLQKEIEEQEAARKMLSEEIASVVKESKANEERYRSSMDETKDDLNSKLSGARLLSIFFQIGKSDLNEQALVNLKQVADIIVKSGAKVTLTGFADLGTGSRARNELLSRQRAQAAYDALVNTYNVNGDLLEILTLDINNQPYPKAVLNRVVLIDFK